MLYYYLLIVPQPQIKPFVICIMIPTGLFTLVYNRNHFQNYGWILVMFDRLNERTDVTLPSYPIVHTVKTIITINNI